ncbi:MAG: hypothetical protein NTY81_02950 [Candidatus Staskawiczbacteria bacterium]|nr:hypothetical protein [Candidatus Staskawiczbacteria bacterium]
MLTNYLAEIWGISIVVVALALLLKESYLKRLFASMQNEDNLFFWGFVTFIIGIAMVLAHNIWVKDWQVIITIFGWASLLKGLYILFLPKLTIFWIKKLENSPFIPFALFIAIFIGLVITYFGFTAV